MQPLSFPVGSTSLGKPCRPGGARGGARKWGLCLCGGSAAALALTLPVFLSAALCIVTLQLLPSIGGYKVSTLCTQTAYDSLSQLECSGSDAVPLPTVEPKRFCALLLITLRTLPLCVNKPELVCCRMTDHVEDSSVSPAKIILDQLRANLALNPGERSGKVSRFASVICSEP